MRYMLLTIACLSGCSHASRPSEATAAASRADTSFASMQERGKSVMGVDQYAATHKFEDSQDGGAITFTSDTGAAADVAAIRKHLQSITKSFAAGDFSDPAMVHMMEVPGTRVMKEKRGSIRYRYDDVRNGGTVKIATTDAAALSAVREFLAFQRDAHHAH